MFCLNILPGIQKEFKKNTLIINKQKKKTLQQHSNYAVKIKESIFISYIFRRQKNI